MVFKFALRNIRNNLQVSSIKIIGLIIGFLTIMYITAWVSYEMSYDKHFSRSERIFRLSVEQVDQERNFYWHFARTWQPWRKDFPAYFPEIENMAELSPLFRTNIKIGENRLSTRKAFASDSSFFKVFDIHMLEGDPVHALDALNTVIISQEYADRYFAGELPINKTIEIERNNKFIPHTITGVFKDIPPNTHFDIDFLLSNSPPENQTGNVWAYTYILLKEGSFIGDIQVKLPEFMKSHVPENQQNNSNVYFTPLTDMHLKSNIEGEIQANGNMKQVRFFIVIAFGVFIMVLVNYINLNMALYNRRIATFTMNRILGAKLKHNFLAMLIESAFLATVALFISYAGFKLLRLYSTGTDFEIYNLPGYSVGLIFLITVVSGSLPPLWFRLKSKAFFLQRKSLSVVTDRKYKWFNHTMLISQFSISILVIVCSIIMTKQNYFLLHNQLGKEQGQLISVARAFARNDNGTTFVEELRKHPEIDDVTGIFENPTYLIKDMRAFSCSNLPENKQGKLISICPADYNFFNFFNIDLVAGNYLQPYRKGQQFMNYILNEKAIKFLGFNSPEEAIGSEFQLGSYNNDIPFGGRIVGVVKDFHFSSLYHPIEPTAYFQIPKYYGAYILKVKHGNEQLALAKAKQEWDRFFPDYPFDYQYLNDVYLDSYKKDLIQGRLINILALCSIIISCIGLIGISGILLVQKTKEIGVHKVNGARSIQVIAMLNMNYIKWIIIAFILATPLAYYFMTNWLDNFAYKINPGWWTFSLGGILVLIVAVFTVTWQSWRAASKNPVEALRYE